MSTQTLEVPGYQVLQYLGSGARSTIWQIRDRRSDKLFALKRVVKRQSADDRFLQQAANEYEVGSQLDHAGIRRIHEIRRIKHWLALREIHLVMEYCEGQTVQESPPEGMVEVVRIFGEVAAALAYMNSRGFVHADTKPNNILVAPDGSVKVIDLGQSCTIGTVKERIQGTPDFIAPEQVHRRPLDARTDVYNFGATLYWTLTGKPIPTVLPKKGQSNMLADLAVVPPAEVTPTVPPSLNRLVLDCVEIRPAARPASMSEVASRLALIGVAMQRNINGKLARGGVVDEG
jgi:serine/threonine-protein kinase